MGKLSDAPRCDDCGKFASDDGATFAAMFDFADMCCTHEHMRCRGCTEKFGPVKSNARPHDGNTAPWEWSIPAAFQKDTQP